MRPPEQPGRKSPARQHRHPVGDGAGSGQPGQHRSGGAAAALDPNRSGEALQRLCRGAFIHIKLRGEFVFGRQLVADAQFSRPDRIQQPVVNLIFLCHNEPFIFLLKNNSLPLENTNVIHYTINIIKKNKISMNDPLKIIIN
ncbi:hypothetical protein SDC9_166140 [bioreactor metagenome]|uniref:Uncharacterized protein n=1 Tax=bioreactor metagenome TaxID=1076179 RepID=A0A645FWD8_9ZZZZ